MDAKRVASAIIPIIVFLILYAIPAPSGVAFKAWLLFAIFVAVIAGLIFRPLPMSAVVLIGVVASALSGALTIGDALAGFADTTVWLIVSAYLFARAFLKTRLGERIAWMFIKAIGKRTLTLGYALSLTDLVIAPGTPSNTARAGGILFPIIRSIAKAYDSEPGPTAKRIGNFLMFNEYQTTLVTGAMFMTGMAANPLVVSLAKQVLKVEISWAMWFLGAIVPGFVAFFLVPLIVYFLTRPEIKESPEAPKLAEKSLKEMGPLKREEKVLIFVFILALALWILSETVKINATTTALLGVALMLVTGVLSWQDVLGERGAWDALVWFGGLVGMAAGLNKLGFMKWMAESTAKYVSGWAWLTAFIVLTLVYFYAHYFMASMTAHVTAFFPPFAAVMATAGAPPLLVGLMLGYMSNLNAAMTHYGTGPAPIYFGAGYVDIKEWWAYGLLISIIHIALWFVLGFPYWKFLGLY